MVDEAARDYSHYPWMPLGGADDHGWVLRERVIDHLFRLMRDSSLEHLALAVCVSRNCASSCALFGAVVVSNSTASRAPVEPAAFNCRRQACIPRPRL